MLSSSSAIFRAVDFFTTKGMVGRQDLRGARLHEFPGPSWESAFAPFCVRVQNWTLNLTGLWAWTPWGSFFFSLFSLRIPLCLPFPSPVIQEILV